MVVLRGSSKNGPYADSDDSNSSMAGKSLPNTCSRRSPNDPRREHRPDCHRRNHGFHTLPVSLAGSGHQYSRMGRLDDIGFFPPADSINSNPANQSVPCPIPLSPGRCADFPLLVTRVGLGRDIWTVPFDDITMMFKVCSIRSRHSIDSF
jgi:hypothetical protein